MLLFKIIRVNSFDFIHLLYTHTDTVLNHVVAEFFAVNKNNLDI